MAAGHDGSPEAMVTIDWCIALAKLEYSCGESQKPHKKSEGLPSIAGLSAGVRRYSADLDSSGLRVHQAIVSLSLCSNAFSSIYSFLN